MTTTPSSFAQALTALPRFDSNTAGHAASDGAGLVLVKLDDVLSLLGLVQGSEPCPTDHVISTPTFAGFARDLTFGPAAVHDRFVRDSSGNVIAYCGERSREEATRIARRLVACINACTGIPTTALESVRWAAERPQHTTRDDHAA